MGMIQVGVWALAAMLLPAAVWAQGGPALKIGYVDLQKALNKSEAGEKAKERIKGDAEKMEARLEKQKTEVEKLKEELEKKGLLLSGDERDSMARDYRQKLRDFERLYKDSQQEIELQDRTLTARLLDELHQIVQEIGEKDGYTLILEGNNTVVLYGAQTIDLTDLVIRLYNQKGSKFFKTAAKTN